MHRFYLKEYLLRILDQIMNRYLAKILYIKISIISFKEIVNWMVKKFLELIKITIIIVVNTNYERETLLYYIYNI
jgi:hypothetical protein